MKRLSLLLVVSILLLILFISIPSSAESNDIHVLFDNAHLQTAGNADWTISGGYSDFADALKDMGYKVDSWGTDDPRTSKHDKDSDIAYDVLKKYDVYIIPEPNDPFTEQEQEDILRYIYEGGRVFFIADHAGADRNRNGWDAVEIFNGWQKGTHDVETSTVYPDDFVGKLGFRFRFDNKWQSPITDIDHDHPIGEDITAVGAWGASSIYTFSPTVSIIVRYKDRKAYVIFGTYGKGAFAAIGDSSPFDDGTGVAGDKLYDGWNDLDDAKLGVNIVRYLATYTSPVIYHTITVNASSGGSVYPSGIITATEGAVVNIQITASQGYHIGVITVDGLEVYTSSSSTSPRTYTLSLKVCSDHRVYVKFDKNIYPVSVNWTPKEGGTVEVSKNEVLLGEKISFTVKARDDYHIKTINIQNGSQVEKINLGKVSEKVYSSAFICEGNIIVDVEFERDKDVKLNVYLSAHEGGTITPSGYISLTYGSTLTFTVRASTGYHIRAVTLYIDGKKKVVFQGNSRDDDTFTYSLTVYATTTVEATFAKDVFTIYATSEGKGYINPSGEVSVLYGEDKTFTFTPDSGYIVKDVIIDGVSKGALPSYTFYRVNADHSLYVIFDSEKIVIVFTPDSPVYYVNGQMLEMDVAPFIDPRYNRTVVPLRFVAEAMGLSVEWNGETREISITGYVKGEYTELIIPMKNLKKVKVKIGGKEEYLYESEGTVYINGEEKNLEKMWLGKPVIYRSRTMVPIRFIAEIFGAKVDWDREARMITITMSN